MSAEVLVIDDDPVQRRLIEAQLIKMGFRPVVSDGGEAGLALLRDRRDRIAAVVLDLMMPGVGGLDVLAGMRRLGREIPVIVLTAKGSIETVVEAMRAGAFDFIVKPVPPEKLHRAVTSAVKVGQAGRRAQAQAPRAKAALDRPRSAAMAPVLAHAAKAATSSISILIEGETGVGKEWLAEAIRAAGPRANRPFVVVNCGALPTNLVESILFGHEKGAFTDASERRAGKFAEADGGTLFLDEVGELPLDIQVKLLRVLQKGEIDSVGGRAPVATDVRVISATNRCLAEDIRSGRFREDLYYRLNVLPIRIPPLRDRRAEIAGLAEAFLRRFAEGEERSRPARLSQEALRLLERHDWPGNIRQLENAIHRALVLSESDILGIEDFPQITAFAMPDPADGDDGPASAPPPPDALAAMPAPPQVRTLAPSHARGAGGIPAFDAAGDVRPADDVEADLIRLAMARYGGRMSEIARRLGIGRSTLYRKMRRYSIADPNALTTIEKPAESLRETGVAPTIS